MTAIDVKNSPPPVKYGSWILVGPADGLRKVFVVRCVCGRVQKIGIDALQSGMSTSCGYRPPTAAARAEFDGQKRRRVIGDRMPERGR